jgi:hypothetical protein
MLTLKILCLAIALAGTETLHGILRTMLLNPRLGVSLAKRVGVVSGSLLALLVCWLMVPWLMLSDAVALLLVGGALAAFMATFDIVLGRLVVHLPWRTVLADFDLRRGNLLVLGLAFLVVCPWLAMWLHARG